MMEAVLSNADHPEYGVVTIPFPIPREQFDHCIELVEALEIGNASAKDCNVDEIRSAWPVLNRLEGSRQSDVYSTAHKKCANTRM